MSERGSVSIVAVAGALMLCLTSLGAADLGSMLIARTKAQAAADAAALAAAAQLAPILGQGSDPEAAARAEAEANGARLERCDCAPGTVQASVEVSVAPSISFVVPWATRTVRASARADLDPDVFSYRDEG